MNDKNLHAAGETEHRSQEEHLTMSKQTDHNTIDKIRGCKHELEIECIELEEQTLTLQNVLMGLQNTRQRLEKKVENR
jgi:predicted metal-dependent phosphoesterase TrpH